jgi:pimeloyl-ACP methyl ester carboxylesterase
MIAADGSVGPVQTPASVGEAIVAGRQRFSEVKVPALAIFAIPHDLGPWVKDDPGQAQAIEAFVQSDVASAERQAKVFEAGVPGSKVVRIRNANHYVFFSHEDVVLREIRSFIESRR